MNDSPSQNPQSSSSGTVLPSMLHIFLLSCVWGGLGLTILAVAAFGFSKIVDPGLPSPEFLALNPEITPNSTDIKQENSTIILSKQETWQLSQTTTPELKPTPVSPQVVTPKPKPVTSQSPKTAKTSQKLPLWIIVAILLGSASASSLITYWLRSLTLNPSSKLTKTQKSSGIKLPLSWFKFTLATPKAKTKATTKKTKPKARHKPQSKRQPKIPKPQPAPLPTPQLRVVPSPNQPLRPAKLPPVLNKSAMSNAVTKEEAFLQEHRQANLARTSDKSISFVTRKM